MLTAGSSSITGQLFARDNQSAIKGIAILNINKKQYAPAGTEVILIPYTAYFKEYLEESKKQRKRGKPLNLSGEALECMRITKVGGSGGKYLFDKLKEGTYFLYTRFDYVHTATRTDVVGQTDHYVNGSYQGSSDITNSYGVGMSGDALVEKLVTIDKDGEVKEVNLKKTL
ncbi:hypothetical protein GCM10022409_06090 [Hymenobacter glaciei]|uniref:Uncharacterized protein n=2 Tax=Hymenobacter glaciei TaxID=877209 RepID=A0ABP7TDT6_9BACT